MKKAVIMMAFLLMIASTCALAGQRSQRMLEKKIERWQERGDLTVILQRVAHMKPAIDQLCLKHGVDPEVMYGLLMQESCANDEAVDYVFKAGKSSKVHVGLGQLNKDKLPKKIKLDPLRRVFAFKWRDAYRYRISINRQVKRGNDDLRPELDRAKKIEDQYMAEWAKRDPRFNPRWNLEKTIIFFKYNLKRSGEPGLAIMAHHGGGNDPVRRVQRWAADHGYPVPASKKVPAFVRKHGLNYFVLYEDRRAGHQYWARKGDGHLTYAFSPMAGSIVFSRYWNGLAPSVQAKIMGSKLSEPVKKIVMAKSSPIREDNKMSVIGFFGSKIAGLWDQTVDVMPAAGHVLLGWLIVVLSILAIAVAIRHLVPLLALGTWSLLKSIVTLFPRFAKGVWVFLKLLFGSKRQRVEIIGNLSKAK